MSSKIKIFIDKMDKIIDKVSSHELVFVIQNIKTIVGLQVKILRLILNSFTNFHIIYKMYIFVTNFQIEQ